MSELPGLRGVTFDVGGTLIEPWPSVGHVYASVAAEFGFGDIALEDLNRQFAAAWKVKTDFDYSRRAWRELVERTFAGLAPHPPAANCFDAIYRRFAQAGAWRVFDDVRPVLARLRERGLKLGIISNWDERLRPLLAELRLLDGFDAVVISQETGHTKPAKEIFGRAASLLAVTPGSICHVGDSRLEDFVGAGEAGLRTVLLKRSSTTETDAIGTLADLPSTLEGFSHGAVAD